MTNSRHQVKTMILRVLRQNETEMYLQQGQTVRTLYG